MQGRALQKNLSLVAHFVRPLWLSVVVASVCAALLGGVSALLGALVGPCIQIITATRSEVLRFQDLLGPSLGTVAERLVGLSEMTAGELLGHLPWLLLGVAAMRAIFTLTQWLLWERSGEVVSRSARSTIANSYMGLDPSMRRTSRAREMEEALASGVSNDIRLMREYLVHFYGGLPRELIQIVFMAVTLFLLSPKLFALFVLGVAPAAIAGDKIGRKLRKRAKKALADYSQLTEWLQQRLLGVETIKHYGTEQIETNKMSELTTALYGRFLQAARVKARTSPVLETFALAALVIVLVVALRDVASGVTTGSVLMSFFATLGLLSQSVGRLGRYLNSNREGEAAIDRIRELLWFLHENRREEALLPGLQPNTRARLVCQGVSARYEGQVQDALSGFNFTFEGGRVYCLAGPSGAGKSTLFNLMLGLLRPSSGTVRFEGCSDRGLLPLCYMPQRVQLAPDSVAANVCYPMSEADEARVVEALRQVGMDQVVAALPQGLATRIGEAGQGLSGGQAQRILLARLHYHRAPFVLVDEGTSALDPEVELLVHALVRHLAEQGAVVITIAHRQGVAEMADELLLLQAGRLVAAGAPEAVLRSETYKDLLA